jgi:hypothetical protein
MSLSQFFRDIESYGFSARVNLASGLRQAVRAALEAPEAKELLTVIEADPSAARAVLKRVSYLLSVAPDARYENPCDSALTLYLWLLIRHNVVMARAAAPLVAREPSLWWSRQLAELVERPAAVLDSHRATTFGPTDTKTEASDAVLANTVPAHALARLVVPSRTRIGPTDSQTRAHGLWDLGVIVSSRSEAIST